MKRILTTLLLALWALSVLAQNVPALEQLKADPRKAYGTDYPYGFVMGSISTMSSLTTFTTALFAGVRM